MNTKILQVFVNLCSVAYVFGIDSTVHNMSFLSYPILTVSATFFYASWHCYHPRVLDSNVLEASVSLSVWSPIFETCYLQTSRFAVQMDYIILKSRLNCAIKVTGSRLRLHVSKRKRRKRETAVGKVRSVKVRWEK